MKKHEYIEREAFLEQKREQYCKDCARRKGMRNGKYKTLYEIGEAPCRACGIDDLLNDVEDFPTADVRPVVRCRDCKHNAGKKIWLDHDETADCANGHGYPPLDWFCADGAKRGES